MYLSLWPVEECFVTGGGEVSVGYVECEVPDGDGGVGAFAAKRRRSLPVVREESVRSL